MRKTLQFDGCSLSYRVQGEGDAVVLIQGVGLHGDGWAPQTDTLAKQYRCISFDNRGMAASQPEAVPITVGQMAKDTLAILDQENIEKVHIVGHSLGGAVAQQLALDAPSRVRSLTLLCTSARGADATAPRLKMIWLGIRSRVGTRTMRRAAFLQFVLSPEYLRLHDTQTAAQELAPIFGHDLADVAPVTMRQLGALKRFDAQNRLSSIHVPALVVSGEVDPIFPPQFGQALAAGIPNAEFVRMPDAAHGLTIEYADQVNTLLLRHFASAPTGQAMCR